MKEIKNTIDYSILVNTRRSGNTTRQADMAIQHLMSGYSVLVLDHYDDGRNRNANKLLFDKILKRLHDEHHASWLGGKEVVLDEQKLIISLVEKNKGQAS